MSKQSNIFTGLLIIFSILASFSLFVFSNTNLPLPSSLTEQPAALKEIPKIPKEKEILDTMTLQEKVGQLFIFGFYGTPIDPSVFQSFKEKQIGGIILLGYNIQSKEQLKTLTTKIQTISKIPLFVAIDQEGGIVSRIKWDTLLTKAQYEINSKEDAFQTAKRRGEILKDSGINMNFAPVLDYITNKNSFLFQRSFRGKKSVVSEYANAMIDGYNDAGIVAVPKHFPGHDNSSVDSHNNLPSVKVTPGDWDEYVSLFNDVIQNTNTKALMTGHILLPFIDSKASSLSSEILQKRLIKDMNFKGVIITDDMIMQAVSRNKNSGDIAVEALLAGNDILLYTGTSEIQNEVYGRILKEVNKGTIPLYLLNEKVLKILHLKVSSFNL